MYTKFFGLTKKPFSLTPDPEFLYLSPKHKKALTVLQYGLTSQAGFTVITGEIGAGKTTLIRHILNNLENDCKVGLITNTHAEFGDLLTWILGAFDIHNPTQNKAERYKIFVDYIHQKNQQNRHVILIVDEAQNMDLQTLEELRLLSNINSGQETMLQLVLIGQPELINKLKTPELSQFAQRISAEFHLTSLDYEQTEKYIYHRINVAGGDFAIFSQSACMAIFYFSGGVPRLINTFCDLSLVYAFADDEKTVSLKTVLDVIKEKKTGIIIPLTSNNNEEAEKIRKDLLEKSSINLANY